MTDEFFSIAKHRVTSKQDGLSKVFECPLDPSGKFKVHLSHLSPDALEAMAQSSKTKRWNSKDRQTEVTLDRHTLATRFVKASFLGWEGLTIGLLRGLVGLKDIGNVPMDKEVQYSEENAVELIVGCIDFDRWATETSRDPAAFVEPETEANEDDALRN